MSGSAPSAGCKCDVYVTIECLNSKGTHDRFLISDVLVASFPTAVKALAYLVDLMVAQV